MNTMFTGLAQALGIAIEADVYHQNGGTLWRHLALLLPGSGEFAIGTVLG